MTTQSPSCPAFRELRAAWKSIVALADVEPLSRIRRKSEGQRSATFLIFSFAQREKGSPIVGYGAPAKGNTLLNYCGIRTDFIDYTVDRNPHKQGRFLPGSHIPIKAPEEIQRTKPDYVLILPWNLADEITEQMSMIRNWGGKFVIPIPEPRVF